MGFLSIGARSFGGVLPWAYQAMVEERRWLTPEDFTETMGLCQVLPGPNVGNASIVLGKRWFGLRGAIVAFLGLFALPYVWVLALALLYTDFASNKMVHAIITGVGAAGAGLFFGTAIKLGKPLSGKPAALVLIAVGFVAAAFFRVSLLILVPAMAFAGILLARKRLL
jgi:chromate transporter